MSEMMWDEKLAKKFERKVQKTLAALERARTKTRTTEFIKRVKASLLLMREHQMSWTKIASFVAAETGIKCSGEFIRKNLEMLAKEGSAQSLAEPEPEPKETQPVKVIDQTDLPSDSATKKKTKKASSSPEPPVAIAENTPKKIRPLPDMIQQGMASKFN